MDCRGVMVAADPQGSPRGYGSGAMCLSCASRSRDWEQRVNVLRLLTLIEDPDALPADAALRLALKILMLTRTDGAMRRCEAVAPPETVIEANADRSPS